MEGGVVEIFADGGREDIGFLGYCYEAIADLGWRDEGERDGVDCDGSVRDGEHVE